MELLTWLEENSVVTWIRESESLLGYTLYLAGHTIGMVFLVGPTLLIAARVFGLAPRLPLSPIKAFRPTMNLGLWLTIITGSVLFATAPVGYVKNGVFIVKIASLVLGLFTLRRLWRALFESGVDPDEQPIPSRVRTLTAATVLLWTVGVVAGRLTAYSLVVVFESTRAFLILVATCAAVGFAVRVLMQRSPEREAAFPIDVRPTPVKGGK